ncbi:MAG: sulfoxide reductase heme-binding subunit YedZ [Rhodospirillaceae bacterium]|nr:sulfoxide reductase heme-binding subunit YedZ [Rhodospirillales bacterium]
MVQRVLVYLKPVVFVICLLPLAWLVWRGLFGYLGVNPIETVNRYLGDWALRFVLIALAVTPLRKITGWAQLARLRRMLGLFAFFYVCLHLSSYLGLDLFFDWQALAKDIVKRRYITLGMAAFVLLVPLAVTSTDAMIRRLGGRRWRMLHKLAYAVGILGVVHYWMMVKADIRQPMLYAAVLAVLLGYRVAAAWLEKARRQRPRATAS